MRNQCNREARRSRRKKCEGILFNAFFASSFALFAPSRLHLNRRAGLGCRFSTPPLADRWHRHYNPTAWGSLPLVAVAAIVGLGLAATARADWTAPQLSEFKNGRWEIVEGPATQPSAVQTDPQVDEFEHLIETSRVQRSQGAAYHLAEIQSRLAGARSGALSHGRVQYRLGDHIKAFYYLDELLDQYPESSLFYTALNRQYDIADGFLNGQKRKSWGSFMSERRKKPSRCSTACRSVLPAELAEKSLCARPIIITPIPSSIWPPTPMPLTCIPIREARWWRG